MTHPQEDRPGLGGLRRRRLLGAGRRRRRSRSTARDGTPRRMPGTPTEAASAPAADPFTACQTVGTSFGLERFLCYRAAANLANERRMLPRPPTRPIVIEGAGFGWTDAGVGFATAAGLGLIGAGSGPGVYRISTAPAPPLNRGPAGWLHNRGRR